MNKIRNIKPILFSTPMVQAILNGTKTQTRRIIKLRDKSLPDDDSISRLIEFDSNGEMTEGNPDKIMDFSKHYPYWKELKPKYNIGDIIYVRETWQKSNFENGHFSHYIYKADNDPLHNFIKWKPSLFMQKEAARIFLQIKNVRIERLQNISESDAIAEGIEKEFDTYLDYYWKTKTGSFYLNPIDSFKSLWEKINGKNSWDLNPYIWVYEFEKIYQF